MRLARVSAATAVLLWAMTGAASAATMTVTTTAEGSQGDGLCSLREAVLSANDNGTNASDCPKGDPGLDVVQLEGRHYTLSRPGTDESGVNGDLDVTDNLTIIGVGAASTLIDGGGVDRVFDVKAVTASLQGVTITGGQAPHGAAGAGVTGSTPGQVARGEPGSPGGGGGGIRNAGTLMLTDCVVTLNHAGNGGPGGFGQGVAGTLGANGTSGGEGRGGAGGAGGRGGGILSTAGSVRLERTVVRDNTAGNGGASGGGFGGTGGFATGASGTGGFGGTGDADEAGDGGDGGGVAATGGTVQVIDSTIAGNSAGDGGNAGIGQGGLGGGASGASGTGGGGGTGTTTVPVNAGSGGSGGGIALSTGNEDSVISGSLIEDNESGDGGNGGEAFGGLGGGAAEPGRPAGDGGGASGGHGGPGGFGGGVRLGGVIRNSTISGNRTGDGGDGGAAHGGKGGSTPGGDSDGGTAFGGDAAGTGTAAVFLPTASSDTLVLLHDTITANARGGAGTPGSAVGGAVGNNSSGGTPGSAFPGDPVAPGGVGGVQGGGTVANTIVSGNDGFDCAFGLGDGGHNISFPAGDCPGAHVDPNLGPLADNGGLTRTHALPAGSPAVDGVPASGSGCLAVDQRGVARPQEAACDIGAYETAPPIVSTGGVSGLTTTAATLLGTVTPNLRTTSYRFEYGPTTAYGNLTPEESLPAGAAAESVSAALSGLTPGATYHYRLLATNAEGASTGSDATFTTPGNDGNDGTGSDAFGANTLVTLKLVRGPVRRRARHAPAPWPDRPPRSRSAPYRARSAGCHSVVAR